MSRRALNVLEPWPTVGYLHEFIGCQTKRSLVYDLQEPFRWIADVAVMEAFESEVLDLRNFYFTGDDYRYRFEPEAKQRFLDLLRERFNSGVGYKGRALKWDTVIEQKTVELGRSKTAQFVYEWQKQQHLKNQTRIKRPHRKFKSVSKTLSEHKIYEKS